MCVQRSSTVQVRMEVMVNMVKVRLPTLAQFSSVYCTPARA